MFMYYFKCVDSNNYIKLIYWRTLINNTLYECRIVNDNNIKEIEYGSFASLYKLVGM